MAADDRTGALETAAVLADRGGGAVAVTVWPDVPPAGRAPAVAVVDLGTRHLDPTAARARVATLPRHERAGHKIDSTLRGNWADEVAERSRSRPVLVVAALPALARTCVDGVVLDRGRPVHRGPAGFDARRPVTSSRPGDLLAAAGASDVTHASSVEAVRAWRARAHGVCVADAASECDIERLVDAWAGHPEIVLAGTSAVIGASCGSRPIGAPTVAAQPVEGPVLVVCGSLHPAARTQIEHAAAAGVPVVRDGPPARVVSQLAAAGLAALTTPVPADRVDGRHAAEASERLRSLVAEVERVVGLGALVVVGGDTTAALLGDAAVSVHGSVLPGTAWSTVSDRSYPVVTRAGGFGDDEALLRLAEAVRRP